MHATVPTVRVYVHGCATPRALDAATFLSQLATEVIRNIRTVATLRKEEYFVSLYEHFICVSYRCDNYVNNYNYIGKLVAYSILLQWSRAIISGVDRVISAEIAN